MTQRDESYSDNAKHAAAVTAATLLDRIDNETIAAHQRVVDAATEYGLRLGRAGLEPHVVLGQMLQSVSAAWVGGIMPRYTLVKGDGDVE
jgi:hypothetical protein